MTDVNPSFSIFTLNKNELNSNTKVEISRVNLKKSDYMLCTRDSKSHFRFASKKKKKKKVESERMEKKYSMQIVTKRAQG